MQDDQRGQEDPIDYPPIGLTVISVPQMSPVMMVAGAPYEVLLKTTFWNKREISARVRLPASPNTCIVVPSTFFPGVRASLPQDLSRRPV